MIPHDDWPKELPARLFTEFFFVPLLGFSLSLSLCLSRRHEERRSIFVFEFFCRLRSFIMKGRRKRSTDSATLENQVTEFYWVFLSQRRVYSNTIGQKLGSKSMARDTHQERVKFQLKDEQKNRDERKRPAFVTTPLPIGLVRHLLLFPRPKGRTNTHTKKNETKMRRKPETERNQSLIPVPVGLPPLAVQIAANPVGVWASHSTDASHPLKFGQLSYWQRWLPDWLLMQSARLSQSERLIGVLRAGRNRTRSRPIRASRSTCAVDAVVISELRDRPLSYFSVGEKDTRRPSQSERPLCVLRVGRVSQDGRDHLVRFPRFVFFFLLLELANECSDRNRRLKKRNGSAPFPSSLSRRSAKKKYPIGGSEFVHCKPFRLCVEKKRST